MIIENCMPSGGRLPLDFFVIGESIPDSNYLMVSSSYGVKRKSILDPFLKEIDELIDKGNTSTEIKKSYQSEGV